MEVHELLAALQTRGTSLRLRGDKLVCSGATKLPGALADAMRAYREELLQLLGREAEIARRNIEEPINGDSPPIDVEQWVDIDGRMFSAAAADLFRRSAPFAAESTAGCYCCGGTRFWRLRAGCPWVCARCQPSDRADTELEWADHGQVKR